MAAYHWGITWKLSAGWLPVDQEHLQTQCSTTSVGFLHLFPLDCCTLTMLYCWPLYFYDQMQEAVRNSVCHNATVMANALMHCGTTSDQFLRLHSHFMSCIKGTLHSKLTLWFFSWPKSIYCVTCLSQVARNAGDHTKRLQISFTLMF